MLDLEELDSVFKSSWFWSTSRIAPFRFRQRDYLKAFSDTSNLRDRVTKVLNANGIAVEVGPVRLLTQLRYFGFAMNPVSFFYCYDKSGDDLIAIIAEVNNTPWGEQHCYVIPGESDNRLSKVSIKDLDKKFHVSPFMSMEQSYKMGFSIPGKSLGVKIENHLDQAGEDGVKKILDVSMVLERQQITKAALTSMLFRFPLISFQIFAGIYWQALRLYLKRIPFISHPKNNLSSNLPNEPIAKGDQASLFPEKAIEEQESESILVS